jgi:hypothetical protein
MKFPHDLLLLVYLTVCMVLMNLPNRKTEKTEPQQL